MSESFVVKLAQILLKFPFAHFLVWISKADIAGSRAQSTLLSDLAKYLRLIS